MDKNSSFQKFYSRLMWEGIAKAALCGLVAGFAANFVAALITWFFTVKGLWISIVVGVVVAAGSGGLFYFKKFRPTSEQIARRVDRLGLEERMITMQEFRNDESYIAFRQSEDAKQKMNTVSDKQIKFRLSTASIVLATVFCVCGVSMSTVTALSDSGKIRNGGEIIGDIISPPQYFEVSYVVENDEGGLIEGEADQLVLEGETSETVVAVADDGWVFIGWNDGGKDPSREDEDIREDLVFVAYFERVEESDDPGEDPDAPDEPSDEPADPSEEKPGNPGDPNNNGNGASGNYEANDQIIDGNTNYKDVYQGYYDQAMEMLKNGESIPPALRAIIESYFGIML